MGGVTSLSSQREHRLNGRRRAGASAEERRRGRGVVRASSNGFKFGSTSPPCFLGRSIFGFEPGSIMTFTFNFRFFRRLGTRKWSGSIERT
jgi:hypothetical protein